MSIKILRLHEVEKIIGLSRSTIYLMIAENSFPKPLKLGKRAVGWPDTVIYEWINNLSHEEVSHV